MTPDDARFMRVALSLARRNLGQTWPNPSVGAVIVKNGRIVGCGYTARGGRPHAETQAIEQAAEQARDATLYVTLEPCSHHGKTPPCAQVLIDAGIARCVVATTDPNPKINGQGIAQMKAAGIAVTEHVCEEEARDINRGFFSVIEKKRPYVALKLATSLDGKIAFPLPNPPLQAGMGIRWLTGEPARNYGHLLRSQFDAIATGIGTVIADDPALTCRLPGLEDRSPIRIVFEGKRHLPPESQLAKTAKEVPVWTVPSDIDAVLAELTNRGITRLLVEAGQKLSTAFIEVGLVDRIYWFRAPITIGDNGLPALGSTLSRDLSKLPRWQFKRKTVLGVDQLEVLEAF